MEEYVSDETRSNLRKKSINETEINNLPDTEFKIIVMKILIDLGRRMCEHRTSKRVKTAPNRNHRAEKYYK